MNQNFKHKLILFLGPEKTGSTSIYEFFSKSFSIKTSRKTKELYFWDKYFFNGFDWYISKFNGPSNTNYIDFSPTYFRSTEACNRIISSEIEDLTTVITLRHPINRAYSHYLHLLKYGLEDKSFIECLEDDNELKASSSYKEKLTEWSKVSKDSKKCFILIFEDIIGNTSFIKQFAMDALKLDPVGEKPIELKKLNKASVPKYPKLARFSSQLSTSLRYIGLHEIVNIAKELNLDSFTYSGNIVPRITEEEKDIASKILDAEIKIYKKLRQQSVNGYTVI
tara:strand:- start:2097 stop:2936 length:840 start_codon:yes stop_codon:yes gene_type:complete